MQRPRTHKNPTADDRRIVTDGGRTFHDLSALERDVLVTVARLAGEQDIVTDADCRTHVPAAGADDDPKSAVYPALDRLIAWGLIDKNRPDRRTTDYRPSADGHRLLDTRAAELHQAGADTNGDGTTQPAGEGDTQASAAPDKLTDATHSASEDDTQASPPFDKLTDAAAQIQGKPDHDPPFENAYEIVETLNRHPAVRWAQVVTDTRGRPSFYEATLVEGAGPAALTELAADLDCSLRRRQSIHGHQPMRVALNPPREDSQ